MSKWNEKQRRKEEFAINKMLDTGGDAIDFEGKMKMDIRDAAMGKGDDELFEKKLSKEEKKALAKAKREAKKKDKGAKPSKKQAGKKGGEEEKKSDDFTANFENMTLKERKYAMALEQLNKDEIVVTYEAKAGKLHANARDINVSGFNVAFHGKNLVEETDLVINYGRRYGFIGPNGSGKSTVMKAIAARSIPIPDAIDIYFLDKEYEASDKTAIAAVFEVQDEVHDLEQQAERLNNKMAEVADDEEALNAIQQRLEMCYEKLDDFDVNTAEARASTILFGLGFTTKMQGMKTREFSGGWRMRIALARALFLKPEFLLLDEPTNHLDMESVLWLEDYLSKWTKILFFVCHSQDFMNEVCTDIVRLDMTYKKLRYYNGNYDTYVKTRRDQDMVQWRQYEAEQRDIAEIKDFIARFGHGTVKMVRQAQSREKLLEKKLEAGLTEKPEEIKLWDWSFPDAGKLPLPVLAIERLSFAYPNSDPLYHNVDFGIDLQTRVALVGPNGAGKTTLFKLICEEIFATKGAVKRNPHLKISRFTQHFEDKLDLEMTPMAFFKEKLMPKESVEKIRSLLGRYGCTGAMQSQVMNQLSAGQKARIVFAIIAHEQPHLLLLDEPTNPLDMESIDSLAECLKKFKGGVVMISHDMRLISQCAEEIYICDQKKITKYRGDIMKFKMHTKKENNKRLAQHQNG
jgi:ATP-binding cassette subfamily F protein 2